MYRGADNNLTIRSQSRYKIWNYLRVRGLMWKRVWKMSSIASSSCTAAAAATCHNPIKDKVSPCTFTSSSSWDYFHIQITIRALRSNAEWSNVHYTTLTENQTWKAHRDERNEPVFFFLFSSYIYLFICRLLHQCCFFHSVCVSWARLMDLDALRRLLLLFFLFLSMFFFSIPSIFEIRKSTRNKTSTRMMTSRVESSRSVQLG